MIGTIISHYRIIEKPGSRRRSCQTTVAEMVDRRPRRSRHSWHRGVSHCPKPWRVARSTAESRRRAAHRVAGVLPLENLSGDPNREVFTNGMTEALITELYKIKALKKVISRTSVMQYKGTKKPIKQIARELDVDALIEGSALREGNEVRIAVQLIHGATDAHRWANTFDREYKNISTVRRSQLARLDCLTPLHYAAQRGHKEIVEVLLAHGADVNIGDCYNRTAAEYAMSSNHGEIVQLLVSKGAGISPLQFALYMKDEAKARSLIEAGADVNGRTPDGTTPLDRAVVAGFKDIVELLIGKGADVNAKNFWDWTPLHSAVYRHKDVVELLIASGADVNARDRSGGTPLSYAQSEGYTEIVGLLRKHGAKE